MSKLFIVAGASGAGKSFLLQQSQKVAAKMTPVKKLTTRELRPYEDEETQAMLDLDFGHTKDEVLSCDYRYGYGPTKHRAFYGIRKGDIDNLLEQGRNPIVIVRDAATIRDIKEDYPDAVVVYLQSILSGEDLKNILEKQRRSDIDIEDRMKRIQSDFRAYVDNVGTGLWDHVLINDYDGYRVEGEDPPLLLQMEHIVSAEQRAEQRREQAIDPNLIFVLMSLDPSMYEPHLAIVRAARRVPGRQLKVKRMGMEDGDYNIPDEILLNIEKAALVVCDLTYERPNVYYELGYARGLGKTVFLCAKRGTEIHFDVKGFHTISYDGPEALQHRIEWALERYFCGSQDDDNGYLLHYYPSRDIRGFSED